MKSKINNGLPLISCLCITENRPKLLKRAMDCFNAQTYQNKQLVILYKDDDLSTSKFIDSNFFPSSYKFVKVPNNPKKRLGVVRNISISIADGDFICIWDDDDWYHMNRISIQYQMLINCNKQGSILTQYLMFDEVENKAYISLRRNYWENSLMCEKRLLSKRKYANKSKGEDTPLVEYLHNANRLAKIENMANIYIYVYHSNNTCNYAHFEQIFNRSQELPEFSKNIKEILEGKHSTPGSSILLDRLLLKETFNI